MEALLPVAMFIFFMTMRNQSVAAIVRFCNPQLNFAGSGKFLCRLGYHSIMYSELVLDHFRNPRNAGKLANASAEVTTTNPICGDILELAVRVNNGDIAEARFLCRGCTTSIACASLLTERLTGCSLTAARSITAEAVSQALGGLPPATLHGAQLAEDALRLLLVKLASGQ